MHSNQVSLRIIEHQKVKTLMRDGDLLTALQTASEALSSYGNHVGLLCDLAACRYELGFFQECAETTKTIHAEYNKCRFLLGVDSKKKTAVFLSKLLEECGLIYESLALLNESLQSVMTDSERQYCEIQIIRLLSGLGHSETLAKKYLFVSSIQPIDYFMKCEVLHALMWAESTLFGFSHSASRWEALNSMILSPQDQRLFSRDFLEIALLHHKTQDPSAIKAASLLKSVENQSFDRFLLELFETGRMVNDYSFSHDISFMQKLRILVLEFKYQRESSKKSEIRKKFIFLLKCCSADTFSLIKKWIPESDDFLNLDLNSKKSDNRICCNGQEAQLSSLQMRLLSLFQAGNTLPLEKISELLWNESWNEYHYDRIRMTVYKLNKLFQKEFGLEAIKVTKIELSLSKKLKIS